MVSRENRVLLASTGTVLLVLVLVVVAVADVGVGSVVAAFVFVGFGVLVPQLYLAATDDEVNPRTRVRAGVLVAVALLWGQWSVATDDQKPLVAGASAALLVGLVAYEFLAGYRSTAA